MKKTSMVLTLIIILQILLSTYYANAQNIPVPIYQGNVGSEILKEYNAILAKYEMAQNNQFYKNDYDKLCDEKINVELHASAYSDTKLYYQLIDISNDNVPELIIVGKSSSIPNQYHIADYIIYDAYTYVNGELHQLFGEGIGYRTEYFILQDNVILRQGSGGAYHNVYTSLNLKSHSLEFEEIQTLERDSSPQHENYYVVKNGNRKVISENEYNQIRLNFSYSKIEWIPISNRLNTEITVLLNGNKVEFDQPPIMADGDRVMVPIRPVAEKMGGTVKWNNKTQSALIVYADRMVVFKNYNNSAIIAKEPEIDKWENYYCDVPPMIVGDRTLTPVRAIAECLGADVKWDGATQTVYITAKTNVKQSITDDTLLKFNVVNSLLLDDNTFYSFTSEIDEFYNSRDNGLADAFIMWWDDWTLGVDNLLSSEKNNVYMVKGCLASILSETSKYNVPNMDAAVEISDWLDSALSYTGYINFAEIGKVTNMSVQTADSLSKLGSALRTAGKRVKVTVNGIDAVTKMLTDYANDLEYINTIKNSLDATDEKGQIFLEALNSLEEDYTNNFVSALDEFADDTIIDLSLFALDEYVTGGAYALASFATDIANAVVGNDDKAAAIRNIHCIHLFNKSLDRMEADLRLKAMNDETNINEYIKIFDIQKISKRKMYEAMDMLRDKKDEYTENRIKEQLKKIDSMTYIIWE